MKYLYNTTIDNYKNEAKEVIPAVIRTKLNKRQRLIKIDKIRNSSINATKINLLKKNHVTLANKKD